MEACRWQPEVGRGNEERAERAEGTEVQVDEATRTREVKVFAEEAKQLRGRPVVSKMRCLRLLCS